MYARTFGSMRSLASRRARCGAPPRRGGRGGRGGLTRESNVAEQPQAHHEPRCTATRACAAIMTARSPTTAWCRRRFTRWSARDRPQAGAGHRARAGRSARVFPQIDLFDRVVAENGALLYTPRRARSSAGRAAACGVRAAAAAAAACAAVGRPRDRRHLGAARDDRARAHPRAGAGAAGDLQQGRGDGAAVGREQGQRAGRRAGASWGCRRTTPSASATPRTTTPCSRSASARWRWPTPCRRSRSAPTSSRAATTARACSS